ncbi:MAG: hypothetical protein FWH55_05190 [Oscillospiraceae bacterium]|nr:hypothetical protein [Oscillospiraceae bacterium]
MYIPLKGTSTTGTVMLDQLVTIDYNARGFEFIESVPSVVLKSFLQIVPLVFQPNEME